jgi:transposase
VITALTLGEVGDVARFADGNHFAGYNGTAPDDKGSAGNPAHRVNNKGNRKLNHAIHMIAITQFRNRTSPGRRVLPPQTRAIQDEERGVPGVEAQDLRRRLPPTRRRGATRGGPGRASGDDSHSQRGRPDPDGRHFGQATARTQPKFYARANIA